MIVTPELVTLVKLRNPNLAFFMEYMMKKAAFRSERSEPVDVLFYQWVGHFYYLDITYRNAPFKGQDSPANIRAMFVLDMKEDKLGRCHSWFINYFGMCRDRYWKRIISNCFRHHTSIMTLEQRSAYSSLHTIFGPELVEMYQIREPDPSTSMAVYPFFMRSC